MYWYKVYYIAHNRLNIGVKHRSSPKINPEKFDDFTYSRRSHWNFFAGCDKELYWKKIAMNECDLKFYQDLLVFLFIKEHIEPGARILEVGGGNSRILTHFTKSHDCWNIDKLEGLGSGPSYSELGKIRYKLVLDYMGNFNPGLPDAYFDFVFSISVLEHTPYEVTVFDNILKDINRVLKPGGYSLHLFDVCFTKNGAMWTNKFPQRIFDTVNTINKYIPHDRVQDDPDLYYMSEAAYNNTWIHKTKIPYADFGRPASLNILWRKPLLPDVKSKAR
jgi:SAM-dependent methyltransferase